MAHEGGGAATAAPVAIDNTGEEPRRIAALIGVIKPVLKSLVPRPTGPARLSAAVVADVRRSAGQRARWRSGRRALRERVDSLVGAVYEPESSHVRLLASSAVRP